MKRLSYEFILQIILAAMVVVLGILFGEYQYKKSELEVCKETKTYDIRQINIDKTGKYYFEDSIFAVELIVWDSLHSGKFVVPVNLNEVINYNDGKRKARKTIKEVICK